MARSWAFTRDILLNGIGFWIVPWFGLTYVVFQLYHQFKVQTGFDDLGLGWPVVVLAMMATLGQALFGARFQAIYERHFPEA